MSTKQAMMNLAILILSTAASFFSVAYLLMLCYNRGIVDGVAANVDHVHSIDYWDACALLLLVMILKSYVITIVNPPKK